jgi:hypothetical protein
MSEMNRVIEDIYAVLDKVISGDTHDVSPEKLEKFGKNVSMAVARALTARTEGRKEKVIYMSEVGRPCQRQLWYSLKETVGKERLEPHTLIKFLYGDILEELVLLLVDLAGHEVTDQQKSVVVELKNGWQLRGRMDAKINGMTIDVKSASSYAFKKFRDGTLKDNDAFGYLAQLGSYVIEEEEELGAFLAIDKQNGTLTAHTVSATDLHDAMPDMDKLVDVLESDMPPPKAFKDKPFGKSGNKCLDINCSYCGYKKQCWPNLRGFVYSDKPVFMTEITREPKVPELNLDDA